MKRLDPLGKFSSLSRRRMACFRHIHLDFVSEPLNVELASPLASVLDVVMHSTAARLVGGSLLINLDRGPCRDVPVEVTCALDAARDELCA